ncbi:M23 family peptidase [Sphingobacteriales bacterium UPWRP_1]|nr:peptidase M23 [Sphingobacteriales bacterium TSM_CSM]PSJ78037.1 M23 family peptidase [Sphingobacteriales bacterium UPWRP_1]
MKKVKYYYNTSSLRYEKVEETWKSRLLRAFGFLCATMMFGFIIVVIAFKFLDSPKEKALKREIAQLELLFEQMNSKAMLYEKALGSLQDRDKNIYRSIFEAEPLPDNLRQAGIGGANRYKDLENLSNSKLITETAQRIDQVGRELYVQSKSYDEIIDLLKRKEEMLMSIPAIQPISNKDLRHIASGFGSRIHPIYKTRRMHTGLDFSAPTGSDVYATGKGRVVKVEKLGRGYGLHVIINHGYSYQTLYAHLSSAKVKVGQWVNRGDIIGKVGSSGTSTAPHLHYEVIKSGSKINPVNFFFNDVTPAEYEQIVELASRHSQSFD